MTVQFYRNQGKSRLPRSCAVCKGIHYRDLCDQYETTEGRIDRGKYLKLCANFTIRAPFQNHAMFLL